MKGYDVIEALGEAADEYVEEAEQRGELKGADTGCRLNRAAGRKEKNGLGSHRGHTWVLKAAAVCALLLVLPAAAVLAVDYFSTLKGDEFAFGRVEYRGNGNVTEEWVIYRTEKEEEGEESQRAGEYREVAMDSFLYENWAKPVENVSISRFFGYQRNGFFSDHINIAGSQGEDVFAVESGTITETGFEAVSGNYIVLLAQDGVKVKYGYLEDLYVSEGQEVEKGAAIGTVGKTGRAIGPNLLLALYVNDKPVNPLREESDTVPEVPEMYLAADLLKELPGDLRQDSVSAGLMVPVFIAFNGAVYSGYDYDVSGDYLIVSNRLVEFRPSYTYTAYQVVGRPDLVAIIINGGYAVYQKVSDVVFSIGGVTYQVECPANYLGEGATGELLSEKNGMKIYQALENQEVIEGKCIVDISKLMSEIFPHLFSNPEENYSDCRWVAAVVE